MTAPTLLRLPLRADPWPPGDNGVSECPVCGTYWRPWAGSHLPCHGRCLLTKEGARACRMMWRSTDKPFAKIAEALDIPASVVKSTLRRFGIPCGGVG